VASPRWGHANSDANHGDRTLLNCGQPCYTAVVLVPRRFASCCAVLLLGSLGTLAAVLGCASCPTVASDATYQSSAVAPRIETTELPLRPRLRLVIREADKQAVAALAVSVEAGAQSAFALAGLTEQRLRAAGFAVSTQAHGAGYSVQVAVQDVASLKRLIGKAVDALARPVASAEPLLAVRARLQQARSPIGAQDLAIDRCSAEPVITTTLPTLSGQDRAAREQLEAWRKQQAAETSALAIVGPSSLLQIAPDALAEATALTGTTNDAQRDPWPTQDVVSTGQSLADSSRLSLAIRIPDAARSIVLARQLSLEPLLLQTLGSVEPSWQIERVAATARPRGACLRIDLKNDAGAPDAQQTAKLARWISNYVSSPHLNQPIAGDWVLQDAISSRGDAREAADVAAWLSLSNQLEAGPQRTALHLDIPGNRSAVAEAFLAALRAEPLNPAGVVGQVAVETGHSTLSVLLASPCGTATELGPNAGRHAAMLTALAQAASDADFRLSPWITPDAVGLLVESRAIGPSDTPEAHADRTARRLVLALTRSLSSVATTEARQIILNQFQRPDPDLWQILSLLSGGQVAALEPRGSWASVGGMVHDDIDGARRAFITEPWRIAVLANHSAAQGTRLIQELSNLLRPLRNTKSECPQPIPLVAATGLWRIEPNATPRAQALVGVPLPAAESSAAPSEAEWLAFLLNRTGGWLQQKLVTSGFITAASAKIWGGRRGRALTIELFAAPDQVDAAVNQARLLLNELSLGGLTSAGDVAAASRFFAAQQAQLQHDRRQRIVRLWQGNAKPSTPTLASLQRFQAQVFGQDRHLVVVADPPN